MKKKLGALCLSFFGLISVLSLPAIAATDMNDIVFEVEQFYVTGDIPAKEEAINEVLLAANGKKYNLSELQAVAKSVEQILRDAGYAFYRIVLPPQTLDSGKVTLKSISFSLGKVEIKGNDYFDDINIRRSLPSLSEDSPLNTYELAESLKVANHNSSKQVKLIFKQSEVADKVEAEISVAEERPYNMSLMFNNAGTTDSGIFRLTAAVQHNNLWNLDHSFNASYTTSPSHADEVMQYGFSYNMPIYVLKGWLSGYYAKSDMNTGVVAGGFDISGSGEMYGLHYLQYLPKFKSYEHWFNVGIDNRFFDNNILFETANIGTDVRSVPFSLRYKAELPWKSAQFKFHIEWAKNIDFGGHNTQADYSATRSGARRDWDLLRYGMSARIYKAQWLFSAAFTGQYSDMPLISGEQIGLGGTYSIRGYKERESSADSGLVLHLEVHTPRWHDANMVTFYDYGYGSQRAPLAGELKSWDLSSLGVGFRWQWKKYIFASLDWAFALNDAPINQFNNTQAGASRLHGNIMLRY